MRLAQFNDARRLLIITALLLTYVIPGHAGIAHDADSNAGPSIAGNVSTFNRNHTCRGK